MASQASHEAQRPNCRGGGQRQGAAPTLAALSRVIGVLRWDGCTKRGMGHP